MRFFNYLEKTVFLLVWFCFYFPAVAQFKVEQIGIDAGLSSGVVHSIIQDRKGFLWVGTEDGLNRYDGYRFKTYRNIPGDSNSIISNVIFSVCEDRSGNIWAATEKGLSRLDPRTGRFSKLPGEQKPYPTLQVLHLGGDTLIGFSGMKPFLVTRNSTTRIPIPFRGTPDSLLLESGASRPLSISSEGEIFLIVNNLRTATNELMLLDRDKNVFIPYKPEFVLGPEKPLLSFYFKKKGDEWYGTTQRGMLFGKNGKSIMPGDISIVNHLLEDREGQLWIATGKGVYLRTPSQRNNFEIKTIIPGLPATGILQDRSGLIWISSLKGIYKYDPQQYQFAHLTTESKELKLKNNFILGIRGAGKQKIMIQYYWGEPSFSVMDLKEKHISHIPNSQPPIADFVRKYLIKPTGIFDSLIFQSIIPLLNREEEHLRAPGSAVYFDKKKNVWNLLTGSLFLKLTGEFRKYTGIATAEIIGDSIWLAGREIGIINIQTGAYTQIPPFHPNPNTAQTDILTAICSDENNNVWIGSKGSGVDCYNRRTKQWSHYSTADGLPSNAVYSLVTDNKQRLWIGTSNGLSCYVPPEKRFYNFYKSSGLINLEFNRYSAYRAEDGRIFMGGMDGIDHFDPDKILAHVKPAPVVITDFRVFNKSYSSEGKIILPHNKNYVTIDFALMDFRNTANAGYAYKLEGIDKDWVPAGKQNSVSYATLSPGNYHFKVKSITQQEETSDVIGEIYFTIRKPWWMSIWLYLATAILVVGIFYAIYKFRVAHYKKLINVRAKISQDLHDEVGATLTTISFLSEVAKNQTAKNNDPVYNTVNKIGGFSRDMIDEMNDIVWAINPSNDRFGKIEDRMQNFASTLLGTKDIELNFHAGNDIQNISLGMQQRKNLYLIFKEAINNAAKYANCDKVDVNVYRKDHHIHFDITDNGKGFDPGRQVNGSGGNGLKNMKLRAMEINARLKIESDPGQGTKIAVSLPITPIAYSV